MSRQIADDPRYRSIPLERVRDHFEAERELRGLLLSSSPTERSRVFAHTYTELFRRVPWHPALREVKSGPQENIVEQKKRIWAPLIGRPPQSVLEIGFGSGELVVGLAGAGYECTGLDVERTRVDALASMGIENLRVLQGDGTRPEIGSEVFDAVVSQQLFEHLHPDDALDHLRAVRSLLKPGGRYFVETPNRIFGPHDVSRFFVDGPAQGFHLREYSIKEMMSLFRLAGFQHTQVVLWKSRVVHALKARLMEMAARFAPAFWRQNCTAGLHNPIYVAYSNSHGREAPFLRTDSSSRIGFDLGGRVGT